jgi:hypothetical protein
MVLFLSRMFEDLPIDAVDPVIEPAERFDGASRINVHAEMAQAAEDCEPASRMWQDTERAYLSRFAAFIETPEGPRYTRTLRGCVFVTWDP